MKEKFILTFGALYLPLAAFFSLNENFRNREEPKYCRNKGNACCQIGQAKIIAVGPPTGSWPMVAIKDQSRQTSTLSRLLRAPTVEATASPKNTRAKISGGPILRIAQFASGSVAVIITELKPCRRWLNREQPRQLPYRIGLSGSWDSRQKQLARFC